MKILVGCMGITIGENLLELAAKHAKAFDTGVLLAASSKDGEDEDQNRINKLEENLEKASRFIQRQGVKCETHMLIRGLDPGEDLVIFAKEKEVDEIILSVRSRSKVGKLIFGSTAQTVILTAECPVVTLR